MMPVFFFIAHEKGLKFHAQPQTGAYSRVISTQKSFNVGNIQIRGDEIIHIHANLRGRDMYHRENIRPSNWGVPGYSTWLKWLRKNLISLQPLYHRHS